MSEKNIKPALSDVDAVGLYCRVAVSDNDWDIKHAVHRVMTSGKWVTPAIIGGTVEITSQHATMNSGGGSEAQDLCRLRGVVHMRRDKKWIVRSDLAQINCLIIPLMRKAPVSDIDARGNRSFGSNFNQLLAGRVWNTKSDPVALSLWKTVHVLAVPLEGFHNDDDDNDDNDDDGV